MLGGCGAETLGMERNVGGCGAETLGFGYKDKEIWKIMRGGRGSLRERERGGLGGIESQRIVKRASLWEMIFRQVVDNQGHHRCLAYQGVRRRGARRDWKAGGRNE